MHFFCQPLKDSRAFSPLSRALQKPGICYADGVSEGAFAPLIFSLWEGEKRPLVILCANEREVTETILSLRVYFEDPLYFPARDLALSAAECRSEAFGAARLEVLGRLDGEKPCVILTTPEALLQTTLPPEVFSTLCLTVKQGAQLSPETLVSTLLRLGYTRAERVEGQGQFSQRGGIVDFFSPGEDAACRVEFFGDEAERVCYFDTQSQKSIAPAECVTLLAAQEMYLTPEAREICLDAVQTRRKTEKDPQKQDFLAEQEEALSQGLSGAADCLFPLCYRRATLCDYLRDALFVVRRPAACLDSLEDAAKTEAALFESAAQSGAFALCRPETAASGETLLSFLKSQRTLALSGLGDVVSTEQVFRFFTRSSPSFGENRAVLSGVLSDLCSSGCRVYLLTQSDYAAQNLTASLKEEGFSAVCAEAQKANLSPGEICVFYNDTPAKRKGRVTGFECTSSRLCLLCEDADRLPYAPPISRRKKATKASGEPILSYQDLKVGDYVVHEAYGIGVFEGIQTITRDGAGRDFIKIRYAGGDNLYLPCSNLSAVSKYIGKGADGTLALSRMGKSAWHEQKRRARATAKSIAKELIELYAERERTPGHAFPADTPWQAQFEENFEYEETAGQLAAAADVKRDMESERPMDRLLCGDVGFGKTEVALRAVFKCVMDSRQAAILAPTTLLVMQHLRTVLARFRGYPVRVETLSRFSTKKQAEKTLAALKDGSCDIVIGTHRLLQKDVSFARLGLLVVDEEQRFGVSHKEKLKSLSKHVDVLTLTATPIPRTLNMALSGVRDLSLLEEAPGDRLPVQTVVAPFDEGLVLGAVQKELHRAGQVFYLVNDIERLSARAAWLQENLPGARVRYAHGKMDKERLSSLWQEMSEGEIDVLVCTTIVETGIDLPNANTLIIEHAERFGLSQLHQLRGRVGRSWRRAYAYFTYPGGRALPEIAEKRLSAIREFTRFGSGFQLAMRDLELRGAGSLLGAEQSGHMEKIGYDLYLRILQDAVLEEQGKTPEKTPDCYIDLPIRARLSESYIPAASDRISLYQRFSALTEEALDAPLRAELCDRFGPLPVEAENLFLVASLRREALALGLEKVSLTENVLSFFSPEFDPRLISLLSAVYGRYFYASTGEKKKLNLRLLQQDPIEAVRDFFFHFREFQKTLS